ncbi:MAG: hypothetical protein REI12_09785 [Pedobacter sp.]|nr:hypothetical protein [Pedobacter sp.]
MSSLNSRTPYWLALLCAASLHATAGGDLGPGEPGWDLPLALPAWSFSLPQQLAVAVQKGSSNEAELQQQGSAQLAVVLQWGQGNQADIEQQGFAQSAIVKQIGTGNQAEVIQHGQFQAVHVLQWGDYQHARIVQKH